jgi:hypothetical protein
MRDVFDVGEGLIASTCGAVVVCFWKFWDERVVN